MFAAIANQQTTVKAAKYGVSANVTPQTAGTFLDRGIMFASRGEFEMAIADFNEAIKINPNMSAAYALRGRALYASMAIISGVGDDFNIVGTIPIEGRTSPEQKRTFEQAIMDFTQALRLDPNNANTYRERGDVYSDLGDQERAIADYSQAIKLNPNDVWAYNGRGIVYDNKGDFDRAIADWEAVLRIDPNDFRAKSNIETVDERRKQYQEITNLNQAIRLNPNDATAYYNRGIYYQQRAVQHYDRDDYYDRAIADYTEAIRLNPNNAMVYISRGLVYYQKKNYDQAIVDYEAALRIDPNGGARIYLEDAKRARGQ
jgi:tetratricopeptide (TPR) repeat protein